MAHEKLRVNGETIDPSKTYTGSHVLALIKASYSNGINHANKTLVQDKQAAYDVGYHAGYREAYDSGYHAGYREASNDLAALRSLLRKLMAEEAR